MSAPLNRKRKFEPTYGAVFSAIFVIGVVAFVGYSSIQTIIEQLKASDISKTIKAPPQEIDETLEELGTVLFEKDGVLTDEEIKNILKELNEQNN